MGCCSSRCVDDDIVEVSFIKIKIRIISYFDNNIFIYIIF